LALILGGRKAGFLSFPSWLEWGVREGQGRKGGFVIVKKRGSGKLDFSSGRGERRAKGVVNSISPQGGAKEKKGRKRRKEGG